MISYSYLIVTIWLWLWFSALGQTDGRMLHRLNAIGVARGCTGCTCTPRAEKKISGAKFTGKNIVSAPQAESAPGPRQSKSPFLGNWEIWAVGVIRAVLACVLRATTKNRSSTFSGKESAPQTKSWLRPCLMPAHLRLVRKCIIMLL